MQNSLLETLFNQNSLYFLVNNLMLNKSITHSYSSKKNTVTTAKSLRFQRKAERLHRRPAIKHSAENGQQNKVYCFPKEMVFEHSNINDNLVIISICNFHWSRLATLRQRQLINRIFLLVYWITYKVLSHNTSEKTDYLCTIIIWGGLSLKTVVCSVCQRTKTLDLNLLYTVIFYLVGLHSAINTSISSGLSIVIFLRQPSL